MANELVGLKIGASQMTAALVSRNGSATLHSAATAPLDAGVVVGGEVQDPQALGAALKAFFSSTKLAKKQVRIGVASNRIGVRTVEIDGVDDPEQLGNAIRFRAQEALPIPLDEAVLDYQVLAISADADGKPLYRVQFVVAYRDLIDGFVQAINAAELQLAGVDLEAFALLRALAPLGPTVDPDDASAVVAVSVGAERSTIAVSNGLICEFTRVLEWGGHTMSDAVAAHVGVDGAEAEALKLAVGLEGPADVGDLDPDQVGRAREALNESVEAFARELVASLQFYQSQTNSLGIGEILIAGGTARLVGFAGALERMVGVAVRVGDPFANLSGVKTGADVAHDPALAVAIGLGLGR